MKTTSKYKPHKVMTSKEIEAKLLDKINKASPKVLNLEDRVKQELTKLDKK